MFQSVVRRIRRVNQIYREKGTKKAVLFVLYRFRFMYSLVRFRKLCQSLGLKAACAYIVQQTRLRINKSDRPYSLYSQFSKYPLQCRPGTSDILVFEQIFVELEYRGLDKVPEVSFIIDCGANVGYSSAYFLSKYPEAYLTAIEPDPENFALLECNLAPYGKRVKAIHSAIWSHPIGLVLSEAQLGDRLEWAKSVREQREGETPIMIARDIGSLIKVSGFERVSILKIDIEGAEEVVFSSNYQEWISKVDNLIIEIHGDKCRSVFMKAIAGEKFFVTELGELTICARSPKLYSQAAETIV